MNLKLPSMIQGWLNPVASPEKLLCNYVATGNMSDLQLLVERFNQSLFHYLLSQTTKETAEDILQTTWFAVMKSKSTEHTNVKSWLFTIARNNLLDELRRQQKWQAIELSEDIVDCHHKVGSVEESYDSQSRLSLFNDAIAHLSFHQREAFIFQQEGFSVHDICQMTDSSFETVKSRLRYARQNIKKVMEQSNEK